MAQEMQRRIISKFKLTKEEKVEMAYKELRKKDKYMHRNKGAYKCIFPTEDEQDMVDYEEVSQHVRDVWNNATLRKRPLPVTDAKNAPTKPKPTNAKEQPKLATTDEPKVAKSKEEIKSIVDRL